MSRYAEVILFDVKPPFQTQGKRLSIVWEDCLPYFPDTFEIETRDLIITVSENLAVALAISLEQVIRQCRCGCASPLSARKSGRWQIRHEHLGSI